MLKHTTWYQIKVEIPAIPAVKRAWDSLLTSLNGNFRQGSGSLNGPATWISTVYVRHSYTDPVSCFECPRIQHTTDNGFPINSREYMASPTSRYLVYTATPKFWIDWITKSECLSIHWNRTMVHFTYFHLNTSMIEYSPQVQATAIEWANEQNKCLDFRTRFVVSFSHQRPFQPGISAGWTCFH